ncbi:McrC family protein [bacterium]|nr:McrC family protein [bacterium]
MDLLSLCENQWVRPTEERVAWRDDRGIRLPRPFYDRLHSWDDLTAEGREGLNLFDWKFNRGVARQFVGVIQVGRYTIEILPKTAAVRDDAPLDKSRLVRERGNLVEMLRTSGLVTLRERGIAPQALRDVPLFEALLFLFASALLAELQQGSPRSYIRREENLTRWKGKLNAAKQTTRNLLHPERFYVNYSEFSPETPLTRILRAGVLVAKRYAAHPKTRRVLEDCVPWLGGLNNPVRSPDDVGVTFTRQTDRFKPVHDFSQQLLRQQVNAPVSGGAHIFTLLFDMNQVFEGYVTQLYREIAPQHGVHVIVQGSGQSEWLLYPRGEDKKGRGHHYLKPDILIRDASKKTPPVTVIDTKWKMVPAGKEATSDLYQLYAYAGQFGESTNILLYPCHVRDGDTHHLLHRLGFVHPHTLHDGPSKQSICSARLNVARDLTDRTVRDTLRKELCDLVFEHDLQPENESVIP